VRRCDRSGVWYGWWRRSLPPNRSWAWREASAVELRQPARDYGSHSLNHDVEDGDCYDGGGVNKGSHLLHRKATLGHRKEGVWHRPVRGSAHGWVKGGRPGGLYWKAILGCCEEGVQRRPVRGSTNGRIEGQPGGGANNGACGAPAMAGPAAPTAVHAGAPTAMAASKGPAAPAARPAGALGPAARKGGPAGGWGRTAAVAPVAVPAEAPAAATAPTARSQEAAAVA
jgi:hypothetical protein